MAEKHMKAGAATACITPGLGTSLAGSMTDRTAEMIHDELTARCLVLDNGETRLALVVLDLIAADKKWLAEIRHQITSFTSIPISNICISCTHTHSAPTPVDLFQSTAARKYLEWAGPRIVDAVRMATKRLQPARIGWAVGREDRVVFNRRYFMKPGARLNSPFPGVVDKVKMNPGILNPEIVKPAGPIDPEVAVLAIQKAGKPDGQPLAIFASYALHYVGGMPGDQVSADYFAAVGDRLFALLPGPRHDANQPFVPILANACFGDINNIDVTRAARPMLAYEQVQAVADIVARAIYETWRGIRFVDWAPLGVAEATMEFAVRKPTAAEVADAKEKLERAPQGPLQLVEDIYARETLQLADWPARFSTIVQAFRIGELGVCALPGEPFAQTGLNIKAKSPFKNTMMIGMANDYAGYLPTEEQHALGGYETWRAKSSFLEVSAATQMEAKALELLKRLGPK
jgi:neutral ceramidase